MLNRLKAILADFIQQADLVLLDKNIFELPPHEISTAQELMTMINGKIVYQRQ